MKSSSPTSIRRFLPWALLGAVAVVQIYLVFSSYGIQWLKAAWRTRNLEAETRSARFLLGQRAANYLQFLEEQVPESVPIVLPYRVGEFSQQSLMQFFLMPRGIPGCGCEGTILEEMSAACVQCLRMEDRAVPAIGDFPPAEALVGAKTLVQHDEDTGWFHGVYLSDGIALASDPELDAPSLSLLLAIPLDSLIYAGIFFLGALAVGAVTQTPNWGDILSSSIPIGLGLWTITLFLVGWAGIEISRSAILVTYLLLAGVLSWLRYRKAGSLSPFPSIKVRHVQMKLSRSEATWLIAFIGVIVLSITAAIISIGRGYSTVDGITNWAIKGYAIAEEGSIFAGGAWGNHGLAYPQNIHLSVALFKVVDGDVLPGSKLLFPLLAVSLTIGCYAFWRRAGVPRAASSLAMLVLASVPLLFFHSTIGFANIPFTAYVVLGVLYLARGFLQSDNGSLISGSLLLGFGAWTRPEGVGYSLLILVTLLVGTWTLGRRLASIAAAVLPQLTISAIWILFGSRYAAEDEVGQLLGRFVPAVMGGDIRLGPLANILEFAAREVARLRAWGLALIIVPAFTVFGLTRSRAERSAIAILVGLAGLMALAISFAMFYVAGYTPGYGTSFLEVSFDRSVLPAVVLLLWASICFGLAKNGFEESLES